MPAGTPRVQHTKPASPSPQPRRPGKGDTLHVLLYRVRRRHAHHIGHLREGETRGRQGGCIRLGNRAAGAQVRSRHRAVARQAQGQNGQRHVRVSEAQGWGCHLTMLPRPAEASTERPILAPNRWSICSPATSCGGQEGADRGWGGEEPITPPAAAAAPLQRRMRPSSAWLGPGRAACAARTMMPLSRMPNTCR